MKNLENSIDVPRFIRDMQLSEFEYNWYEVSSVRNEKNNMLFHFTVIYRTDVAAPHDVSRGIEVTFDYDDSEGTIENLRSNIDNKVFHAASTNLQIAQAGLADGLEQVENDLIKFCPFFYMTFEKESHGSDIVFSLRQK